MNNLSLKAIAVFLLLFGSCVYGENDSATYKDLFRSYVELIEADSVSEIESHFTNEYNDGLKNYFIRRCGLLCKIKLSESWKEEYSNYLFESNIYAREFNVALYDFEENGNSIKLTLAKESCDGQRSQEILLFVQQNSVWKIDKVEISSWSKGMLQKYDEAVAFRLRNLCKELKSKLGS